MNYRPEYIKELLQKHMEQQLTAAEQEKLLLLLDLYDDEEISSLLQQIEPTTDNMQLQQNWEMPPYSELGDRIHKPVPGKIKQFLQKILYNVTNGIVIIVCAVAIFWLVSRPGDIIYSCGDLPGNAETPTNKYTCRLVMANGDTVLIDSNARGLTKRDGNNEISITDSGVVVYKRISETIIDDTGGPFFGSIITGKGSQYRVVLPDGTKVRLNAATSIRFATSLTTNERIVEMTGEAYFDIAYDEHRPFLINTGKVQTRSTAGRLNIRAYSPAVVATLIEGDLALTDSAGNILLKPGRKAMVGKDNSIKQAKADTIQAISWKNAWRIYPKLSMKEFVQDMARWYDLEIVNMGCVRGGISVGLCYDTPLEEVLKIFREAGLRFKRVGKQVIFCK